MGLEWCACLSRVDVSPSVPHWATTAPRALARRFGKRESENPGMSQVQRRMCARPLPRLVEVQERQTGPLRSVGVGTALRRPAIARDGRRVKCQTRDSDLLLETSSRSRREPHLPGLPLLDVVENSVVGARDH